MLFYGFDAFLCGHSQSTHVCIVHIVQYLSRETKPFQETLCTSIKEFTDLRRCEGGVFRLLSSYQSAMLIVIVYTENSQ